jgi:hypothetical protein
VPISGHGLWPLQHSSLVFETDVVHPSELVHVELHEATVTNPEKLESG